MDLNQEISFEDRIKEILNKYVPYFNILLSNKNKLLTLNTIILLLSIIILFFIVDPYYDSSIVILPDYGNQSSSVLSQLSGLASLAGVSVGSESSAEIYQNLLTSEPVLEPIIYKKYYTEKYQKQVNLIEYFEVHSNWGIPDTLADRHKFLKLLKELVASRIKIDVDKVTQILTITIQMPERSLSMEVANGISESLNNYILTQRKSFASEQRNYIEKRLNEVNDSLKIAEDNLVSFQENNRAILQSPELLMEKTRLTRNLEIKQIVYLELMKQLEIVKIEEIKDTPVINIRETAKLPVEKAGPKRFLILVSIMFLCGILTSLFSIFHDKIKYYINLFRSYHL